MLCRFAVLLVCCRFARGSTVTETCFATCVLLFHLHLLLFSEYNTCARERLKERTETRDVGCVILTKIQSYHEQESKLDLILEVT